MFSIGAHAEVNFSLQHIRCKMMFLTESYIEMNVYENSIYRSYIEMNHNRWAENTTCVLQESECKVNFFFCCMEGSNLEQNLLLLFCGHGIKCLDP